MAIFKYSTANQCLKEAASLPTPNDLFYSLIYEGQITTIFADTGVGKSILAVQIGENISETKKVLYVDLELSNKQFGMRYSEHSKHNEIINYKFNNNFLRASFSDELGSIPEKKNIEDVIFDELETLIELENIEVFIFDNISMISQGDTDKSKDVNPLMKKLISLKRKYNLTLIIVDHTKKRDEYKPISINDLNGSKMKSNFVDSVLYIGKSRQAENMRYISQLKCRSSENLFNEENVVECEIVKENAFLHFYFLGTLGSELDHIKQAPKINKSKRNSEILSMHAMGVSNVEIGRKYSLSEGAIRKIIAND